MKRREALAGGAHQRQELASGRDLIRERVLASRETRLAGMAEGADAGKLLEQGFQEVEERAAILLARGREHREPAFADARHRVHLAHVPTEGLSEFLLGA